MDIMNDMVKKSNHLLSQVVRECTSLLLKWQLPDLAKTKASSPRPGADCTQVGNGWRMLTACRSHSELNS
jgi:hypothetical protein